MKWANPTKASGATSAASAGLALKVIDVGIHATVGVDTSGRGKPRDYGHGAADRRHSPALTSATPRMLRHDENQGLIAAECSGHRPAAVRLSAVEQVRSIRRLAGVGLPVEVIREFLDASTTRTGSSRAPRRYSCSTFRRTTAASRPLDNQGTRRRASSTPRVGDDRLPVRVVFGLLDDRQRLSSVRSMMVRVSCNRRDERGSAGVHHPMVRTPG